MTAPTTQVTTSTAPATGAGNGPAKDAKSGDGFDALFAAMFAQMQSPHVPNTVMKLGPDDGPASHAQFAPPNSVMKVDPTNGGPNVGSNATGGTIMQIDPNGSGPNLKSNAAGGTIMQVGPNGSGPNVKSNAAGGTIMQIGPNGSGPNLKSNATGGTIMQIGPNGSGPNLKSNATGGTIMQIGPNGSGPNLKSNAAGGSVMKLDPQPQTRPSASQSDLTGTIDLLKPLQTQPNVPQGDPSSISPNASQGSVILMQNPPVQPNVRPDTGNHPQVDPNANGSVVMKFGPPPPLVTPNAGGNTKMIEKPQAKPNQDDHPDDGGTIDKVTPPTLSTHAADPVGAQPQQSSHATLPDHGQGPQPNADGKPQIMQVTPPPGVAPNATPALGGTVMKETPPATMPATTPDMAALATHIAAKVKDGEKQFDIRLDPPDFGRVDVRLSVSSDGKAQAHVMADKPQTLDLLQRDQATLHRALKDTGLDLGNNSLNFSLKGQDRGDSGAGSYPQRTHAMPVVNDAPDTVGSLPIYASRNSDSRLDIRI